jgi:hypothetical protein
MGATVALSAEARVPERNAPGARSGRPAPAAQQDKAVAASRSITTGATLSGTPGANGWYVSPVTVTLTVTSAGEAVSATLHRMDGGDWLTYTAPFAVITDGAHLLEYYSIGSGGTVEPTGSRQIAIDAAPPASSIDPLASYQAALPVALQWSGNDDAGSGVASFDIQYRDGYFGVWHDWLTHTTALSGTFGLAQRGHTYYFRSRAQDAAGNSEAFRAGNGDTYTFVDSVQNGGFETGSFAGWSVTGQMTSSIVSAPSVAANGVWAGLLGSPDYGPSIWETDTTHVPMDAYAAIAQVVRVPSLADMPAPAVSLWYRILTYDVIRGCSEDLRETLFDSFDVYIRDQQGDLLSMPVRDGNDDCYTYTTTLIATGQPPLTAILKQQLIDLTSYAGQRITIEMRNSNRVDWSNNTWTYVDSIRVINQPMSYFYRLNLPIIQSAYPPSRAQGVRVTATPSSGTAPPKR